MLCGENFGYFFHILLNMIHFLCLILFELVLALCSMTCILFLLHRIFGILFFSRSPRLIAIRIQNIRPLFELQVPFSPYPAHAHLNVSAPVRDPSPLPPLLPRSSLFPPRLQTVGKEANKFRVSRCKEKKVQATDLLPLRPRRLYMTHWCK